MSTLADKLAIKNERTFGVLADEKHVDFPDVSTELGLGEPTTPATEADVVLLPASTEEEMRHCMSNNAKSLSNVSAVWICYKKGNAVEINREKLWIILADYNWKAVSQVSLNDNWSALRVRPMNEQELMK